MARVQVFTGRARTATAAPFSSEEVPEHIFWEDVRRERSDPEDEGGDEAEAEAEDLDREQPEDVSEEEDGEEYDPDHEPSSSDGEGAAEEEEEEEEEEEGGGGGGGGRGERQEERSRAETFLSKSGKITWSSVPCGDRPARTPRTPTTAPGPTARAVSGARDLASTFRLFVTPAVEKIVLDATNAEGARKRGDAWKGMDQTDLRAYLGLLILAGVYRSRGEAAASLWDAESGRAVFCATMPLKRFYAYSRLLRFDDRETRAARRASDRLAAVREVWDAWVRRLPYLYNPGPEVTVDEQLVPFRGRCPFRQYMPSKPAKYGIKSWVACDARSSYAWNMQVYTGKAAGGEPEKNQGMRVVLELTRGLGGGRNVTCDNFFTSYELGLRLLERNLTMVGTVRKNKPELPRALVECEGRPASSSKFAFTPAAALVSYVPKRNRNVLLLSTLHADAAEVGGCEDGGREDGKPAVVLDYNRTKGGVDNLDKVIATYSCRRMTARWPLAVFHNIVDVSAYNAYVLWREINPGWMAGNRNRRRVFLERLGKELVKPLVLRREGMPRAEASAAFVRSVRRGRAATSAGDDGDGNDGDGNDDDGEPGPSRDAGPAGDGKRRRCQVCPRKKDSKTRTVCRRCSKYVCRACSRTYSYCHACADELC